MAPQAYASCLFGAVQDLDQMLIPIIERFSLLVFPVVALVDSCNACS